MSEYVPYCIKDGDIVKCDNPEFYVLNSKFAPKPVGAVRFCVKKNSQGKTTYIGKKYDPFDKDEGCADIFYSWLANIPNTKKIYLYKEGDFVTASFTEKDLPPYFPNSINVLTRIPKGYVLSTNICIPDMEKGLSLKDCVGKLRKNNLEPTILNYIREKNRNKKRYDIYYFVIIPIFFVIILYFATNHV